MVAAGWAGFQAAAAAEQSQAQKAGSVVSATLLDIPAGAASTAVNSAPAG